MGLTAHLDQALYRSSWAYYGSGIRSRPGTLIVTPSHILHHSYSIGQTIYALFEPSVGVAIAIEDVARAAQLQLGVLWWLMLGYPSGAARLMLHDRNVHDLMLHENPDGFRDALAELGVSWQKLKEPRRRIA